MADHLDLYYNDYDKFIDHCKELPGTFAIKVFIDGKIKKYTKDNDDLITCMKERIEKHYPEIDYDLDEDTPFYTLEILNFNIDYEGENDPAVRYLYSYLCFLSESPEEVNKIMGIEDNGLPVDPNKSFNTGLDEKRLLDLFTHLVKYEFLERNAQQEFLKIFSNQPLENIDAIRWLGKSTSGADMLTLFEMVKHLCRWEYIHAEKQSVFFSKVNSCFKRPDDRELEIDNIEPRFSKWKKQNLTNKILRAPNFRNKQHLLIIYLADLSS